MSMIDQISNTLTAVFGPKSLKIADESELHAGHAGERPEGETYFRVRVVSDAFEGLSRVMRHRMVNKVLNEELSGRVHALALSTFTPEEANAQRK